MQATTAARMLFSLRPGPVAVRISSHLWVVQGQRGRCLLHHPSLASSAISNAAQARRGGCVKWPSGMGYPPVCLASLSIGSMQTTRICKCVCVSQTPGELVPPWTCTAILIRAISQSTGQRGSRSSTNFPENLAAPCGNPNITGPRGPHRQLHGINPTAHSTLSTLSTPASVFE